MGLSTDFSISQVQTDAQPSHARLLWTAQLLIIRYGCYSPKRSHVFCLSHFDLLWMYYNCMIKSFLGHILFLYLAINLMLKISIKRFYFRTDLSALWHRFAKGNKSSILSSYFPENGGCSETKCNVLYKSASACVHVIVGRHSLLGSILA